MFDVVEKEEHILAQGATTIVNTLKLFTYIKFEKASIKQLVDPYVGVRPNCQTYNCWQECK